MRLGSYSYEERKGLRPISWEFFHGLCKGLAVAVAEFNPTVILGIARGGLYPAALLSNILRKDLYPVRLTRRSEDIVVYEHPIWLLKPPSTINGLRVLIVDEICDSGETLLMVKEQAVLTGASEVRSASLYCHNKSKHIPDYIGIITDELILNPWDREVYLNEKFVFHPEYLDALERQKVKPDKSLQMEIIPVKPVKEWSTE